MGKTEEIRGKLAPLLLCPQ